MQGQARSSSDWSQARARLGTTLHQRLSGIEDGCIWEISVFYESMIRSHREKSKMATADCRKLYSEASRYLLRDAMDIAAAQQYFPRTNSDNSSFWEARLNDAHRGCIRRDTKLRHHNTVIADVEVHI